MEEDKEHWSSASLRILSEQKSIEYINTKLNTQPTEYRIKGERCSINNPKSMIREVNVWLLDSKLGEYDSLQLHIEDLISFVREKSDAIKELQPECEFSLACAYSSGNGQGGFTLHYETLRDLAAYPIDLSINLYSSGRDEE